jgi:3-phenylpropionate/cinnamic acid dioxygenase small subunit
MQEIRKDALSQAAQCGISPEKPQLAAQIRYGDAVYNEVMQFLIEEAHLLDEGLFSDWLKILGPDFVCTMPVRQSVHRTGGSGFSNSMNWTREDLGSLTFKVKRLQSDSAFNEDPPSRTRRLITNLRLHETAVPNEVYAQSYLLLRRNRGDAHDSVSLSARRDDVLRRSTDGWKLVRRTVWMDQAVLGMPNLSVFL